MANSRDKLGQDLDKHLAKLPSEAEIHPNGLNVSDKWLAELFRRLARVERIKRRIIGEILLGDEAVASAYLADTDWSSVVDYCRVPQAVSGGHDHYQCFFQMYLKLIEAGEIPATWKELKPLVFDALEIPIGDPFIDKEQISIEGIQRGTKEEQEKALNKLEPPKFDVSLQIKRLNAIYNLLRDENRRVPRLLSVLTMLSQELELVVLESGSDSIAGFSWHDVWEAACVSAQEKGQAVPQLRETVEQVYPWLLSGELEDATHEALLDCCQFISTELIDKTSLALTPHEDVYIDEKKQPPRIDELKEFLTEFVQEFLKDGDALVGSPDYQFMKEEFSLFSAALGEEGGLALAAKCLVYVQKMAPVGKKEEIHLEQNDRGFAALELLTFTTQDRIHNESMLLVGDILRRAEVTSRRPKKVAAGTGT